MKKLVSTVISMLLLLSSVFVYASEPTFSTSASLEKVQTFSAKPYLNLFTNSLKIVMSKSKMTLSSGLNKIAIHPLSVFKTQKAPKKH